MVSRASAKKKGSSFERLIADCLAEHVDDRIDRQIKTGTKDVGDIGGLRFHGHKVAVECKNEAHPKLGPWSKETEQERVNLGAIAGVTVHKRVGKTDPMDQWVTLTMRDFVALMKEGQK